MIRFFIGLLIVGLIYPALVAMKHSKRAPAATASHAPGYEQVDGDDAPPIGLEFRFPVGDCPPGEVCKIIEYGRTIKYCQKRD